MSCPLLDIGCHLQSAAWEWWAEVGLLNKALIIGGLVLIFLAASRSVLALVHKVGGWPAVIGFVLAAIGLVLALLPREPERKTTPSPAVAESKGPFQFGVERRKKKPGQRTRTIFDMLPKRRP